MVAAIATIWETWIYETVVICKDISFKDEPEIKSNSYPVCNIDRNVEVLTFN